MRIISNYYIVYMDCIAAFVILTTTMNKIKVWTGVGACVLMGAASSALAESQVEISRQAPPNLEQPNMRQAIDRVIPTDWLAQGGEGGEGGTGGFQDRLEASELIRELQKGGYVIFSAMHRPRLILPIRYLPAWDIAPHSEC